MSNKPVSTGKRPYGGVSMRSGSTSAGVRDQSAQESFDSSLLVGPVHEYSAARKKTAIKQELSDITKRLHQTLYTYDAIDEYSRETATSASYVTKVKQEVNNIESKEMRDHLNFFIGRYEEMTSSVAAANRERDDLLLQLADWFTADHTDLGVDSSINEKEEQELTKSYAETVATFEKLKRIQNQLNADPGRKAQILAEEKKHVGKKVLDNLQLMKTISIQTMKVPAGSTEFIPWKDAADEIVGMMKKVRQESSEEVTMLTDKIYQLLGELEKQQLLFNRLNKDIKREKMVKSQLADDCTDLKVQLVQAKESIIRYETDLEKAKKMIKKLRKEKESRKTTKASAADDDGEKQRDEEAKIPLSTIIAQLNGENNRPHEMSSDPSVLRTQIREQEDRITALTKELKETDLKVREFEPVLAAKDVALVELGNEINSLAQKVENLTSSVEEKDKEIKKLSFAAKRASSRPPPSCKKCSRTIPAETPTPAEKDGPDVHINKELQEKDTEIEKLTDVIQHLKKLLAETEMKLSDAYREISDLRILQTENIIHQKKSSKIARSEVPIPSVRVEHKVQGQDVHSIEDTKSSVIIRDPVDLRESEPLVIPMREDLPVEDAPLDMVEDGEYVEELDLEEESVLEVKEEEAVSPAKPIKPKTAVLSVEKQKSQPKRTSRKERTKLPALNRKSVKSSPREPVHVEPPIDPEAKSRRNHVLYQVGDLQSRMNVILNMVANFVSTVSSLIYKDPQEPSINGVKAFEFGCNANTLKRKEVDPKELESQQKRAQVLYCGQSISKLVKEVYNLLSTTLNLQHSEFEMIYRSFKKHQQKRAIEQAIMSGSLQKYYDNGGRSTSYDYHKPQAGSSISAEDLGQQNVLLYGFHRSKSELDVHSNFSSESFTTQFLRERSQVFLTNTQAETPQGRKTALGHYPASREEVCIAKTTVPKKGLIKLTALDNELKNPLLFDKKEKEVLPMEAVREQQRKQQKYEKQRKMLIRRKDIMNQVNIGSLHLAEEKEKHNLEMQIENYTLGDLHRNLNELTNAVKHPSSESIKKEGTKSLTPQPRGLALPSINTINLF
nr:kinesin-related protein 4 isoform X2 [Crassostrea gigas]